MSLESTPPWSRERRDASWKTFWRTVPLFLIPLGAGAFVAAGRLWLDGPEAAADVLVDLSLVLTALAIALIFTLLGRSTPEQRMAWRAAAPASFLERMGGVYTLVALAVILGLLGTLWLSGLPEAWKDLGAAALRFLITIWVVAAVVAPVRGAYQRFAPKTDLPGPEGGP